MGPWLRWLESTPVGVAMRESAWLYPAVETTHILGIVLLVGSAAMFDLRLLGLSRGMPVTSMARHLLPWARAGLALAAPTGALLFITDAEALSANPAFRVKLALITLAILNAAAFHQWPFKSVEQWDQHALGPRRARLAGAISLTLWTATIAAGRLIAYV